MAIGTHTSLLHVVAISLSLGAPAFAQSFNIDLHGPTPATIPSPAYGAAAGQPGVWNAFPCTGYCDGFVLPLLDLAGATTAATVTAEITGQPIVCSDPTISGDDEALLENGMHVTGFDHAYLVFGGLDPGTYDLYAYMGGGCATTGSPQMFLDAFPSSGGGSTEGTHQAQSILGTGWNGGFQDHANYGRFRFRLPAGFTVILDLAPGGASHSAQGVQLVKLTGTTQSVCFGTNDLTIPCPCGTSAWLRGCPSSFSPLGAGLTGTGSTQVSADGLQITAMDVSNSMVTLFQGTQIVGSQAGAVFGDGLRCAGGSAVRIATKAATLGVMTYPEGNETPISVRGAIPAAGGYRAYQVWYRNAAAYCTMGTFNLTNAVAVDWGP